MRFTRWSHAGVALAVTGLAAATPGLSAASAASPPGPVVRLEAAQHSGVTVRSFRGFVLMDPGIWVASLDSALQFDVRRVFFFNDTATTEIYTLSLHDALPI